jgi:hypothetical protein
MLGRVATGNGTKLVGVGNSFGAVEAGKTQPLNIMLRSRKSTIGTNDRDFMGKVPPSANVEHNQALLYLIVIVA